MNVYVSGWKLPLLGLDEQRQSDLLLVEGPTAALQALGRLPEPKKPASQNACVLPLSVDRRGPGARRRRPQRTRGQYLGRSAGRRVLSGGGRRRQGQGINWAANGIYARIGKMDRGGRWLWMAGDKATGFAKPGQFYKPGTFAGIVDGCLFVTDWNGQYRIFDKNSGLYVGTLFHDAFRGAAPDENLISRRVQRGARLSPSRPRAKPTPWPATASA